MTTKLDWTPAGPFQVAPTRQRDKIGIVFWRIRRLPNGRWDATDSTPWALGDSGLESWPTFDTAEAAKAWCEAADEKLAGGVR